MTNQSTNVTTGEVRLSYVNLFQPRANNQGEEPKYSATVLIPKSDTATMQRIQAAVQAAIAKGVESGFWSAGAQPDVPIRDGDGLKPQSGEPYGPECKGHWVIACSSKQKQEIVDINMSPIIDQTQVYSGMYGRVNINFYPYNNRKKGIGAGLGPVQKLRDGEPLGGRMTAEAAFGSTPPPTAPASWGTPTQAYGQQPPAYGQQPGYGAPQQPNYGAPAMPPQQPGYGQPPAPQAQGQGQPTYPQVDPITGKPIGGIMGL